MKWTLQKDFRFEASHLLPHHDGKCARLHGHSWKVTLKCQAERLEETGPRKGMLLDFGELTEVMKPLLENQLDHWHLNDTTGLESPTSEMMAQWIFDQIKPKVSSLDSVLVEETCTGRCEYRR